MPEPLSPEGYAATGGTVCPACGFDEIVQGDMQHDGVSWVRKMGCPRCRRQWWEVYELTGYVDLSPRTKEDIPYAL